MKRNRRDQAKRLLFRLYRLTTRAGFQLVPVHYYSPLPNILQLERTRNTWARPSDLPGLSIDLDAQVQYLQRVCRPYFDEYKDGSYYGEAVKHSGIRGYGEIDSQVLHAVLRHLKPSQVIEVGSGTSTFCILQALRLNRQARDNSKMLCIDPYPHINDRWPLDAELRVQQVQDVSLDLFMALGEGDFLFIDSSHQVKPGGDVNYLILEVLPRLRSGVVVHFHDIYFPYDYPWDVLKNFFPFTETSLLRAFLAFNRRYDIMFSLSLMHYERAEALQQLLPLYSPYEGKDGLIDDRVRPFEEPSGHFPSATYIRVT